MKQISRDTGRPFARIKVTVGIINAFDLSALAAIRAHYVGLDQRVGF